MAWTALWSSIQKWLSPTPAVTHQTYNALGDYNEKDDDGLDGGAYRAYRTSGKVFPVDDAEALKWIDPWWQIEVPIWNHTGHHDHSVGIVRRPEGADHFICSDGRIFSAWPSSTDGAPDTRSFEHVVLSNGATIGYHINRLEILNAVVDLFKERDQFYVYIRQMKQLSSTLLYQQCNFPSELIAMVISFVPGYEPCATKNLFIFF